MRAGISTDDYIDFEGEELLVLDTSPYKSVTCGTCTSCGAYYRGWIEDRISYESYLEIKEGKLRLSDHCTFCPDWRPVFDKFTHGEIRGVTLPYTGWLLLTDRWLGFYGDKIEALCVSDVVKEVHLTDGIVDQVHDSAEAAKVLAEEATAEAARTGKRIDRHGVPEHSVVRKLVGDFLVGTYHFMFSEYGGVAKKEKWGYYDANLPAEHECAMCRVLLEKGIVPLKKPRTPRKRKYRVVEAPIERLPLEFQRMVAEKGRQVVPRSLGSSSPERQESIREGESDG